jgi:hypothetical protein
VLKTSQRVLSQKVVVVHWFFGRLEMALYWVRDIKMITKLEKYR